MLHHKKIHGIDSKFLLILNLGVHGQMRRSNLDEQSANLNWAESSSQACRNEYTLMPPISNATTSFPGTHFHILIYSYLLIIYYASASRIISVKILFQISMTLKEILGFIHYYVHANYNVNK